MKHTPRSLAMAMLLSATAVMFTVSGSISAHVTGAGQGSLSVPTIDTSSSGGPGQIIRQGSLHGAASDVAANLFIEKITIGILLILVGYTLHAMAAKREFAHARKSSKKKSKR